MSNQYIAIRRLYRRRRSRWAWLNASGSSKASTSIRPGSQTDTCSTRSATSRAGSPLHRFRRKPGGVSMEETQPAPLALGFVAVVRAVSLHHFVLAEHDVMSAFDHAMKPTAWPNR